MVTRYTVADMPKVPTAAEAAERWEQNTAKWAQERAVAGQLVEPLPSALWAFDPGLRKVSLRSRNTATITLGRDCLRHLGVQIGDYVRLIARKDGSLTLRKATAKDLRQANPYTRLAVIPGKKGKKAAS
jgi:hypothetical protein